MKTKISILGCGWLGLPLAKAFIEIGYSVNGSTTTFDKLETLQSYGINAFQISVGAGSISGDFSKFLGDSSTLIIDIPPKLRKSQTESFVEKIKSLIPLIHKSAIKKVLFISSTSVYAENNSVITEESQTSPETESGRQLVISENLLKSETAFQTTILRFGGLTGDNRKPGTFMAGKQNLENPEAPINLIHQKDCIGIILKIIEMQVWNETFNAAAPFHPTRKTFYTNKAIENDLPIPEFNSEKSFGKTINSEKLQKVLSYEFQVPNL